ncbi:hypothetical protein H0H81_011734 [Sphagnurus paluster]|uniref:Uncharacterized protein n=1 Tax=Sphagnurus paluster TaxID=117069 RepID=A0A9P7GV44_9AGAR|nr:hypothetical protein H0H81_011734 [Sphagnurus paluster]
MKITLYEIPEELQDFYDQTDPFAISGEACFTPGILVTEPVPPPNLCDFGPYRRFPWTHKRTASLTRHASFRRLLITTSVKNKSIMKTTIYDLSTADVVPNRLSVAVRDVSVPPSCKSKIAPKVARHRSATLPCSRPKFILTVVGAAASPTESPSDSDFVAPSKRSGIRDLAPETGGSYSVSWEGMHLADLQTQTVGIPTNFKHESPTQERGALTDIPIPQEYTLNTDPLVNLCAFDRCSQSAQFPSLVAANAINPRRTSAFNPAVLEYRHSTGSPHVIAAYSTSQTHPKGTSLRPLVLPTRVASRTVPVFEADKHPESEGPGQLQISQGLNAIIDLLDG